MYRFIVFLLALSGFTIANAADSTFTFSDNAIHQFSLGISSDTHTLKLSISNDIQTNEESQYLTLQKYNLDYVEIVNHRTGRMYVGGQLVKERIGFEEDPYFFVKVKGGDSMTLRVVSNEQIILPISVSTEKSIKRIILYRNVLAGVFIGVLGALFFYNLILYFFLRDKNYLFYILYLLFIGIAQLDIIGFNYYLFSSSPSFANVAMHYCSGLSGIFAMLFFQGFMDTKNTTPNGHKVLTAIASIYLLVIIAAIFGYDILSYQLVQLGGLSVPASLYIAIVLASKGNSSGKYVVIAWTLLVFGVILYALKDFGIIPFNVFTTYALSMGVVTQVVLISVALANQINNLNTERDLANKRVVSEIEKNKQLIQDQNVNLEKKVVERTAELQQALDDLKAAQSKLVQAEKMASLGTLTAGIAHEINNPINFVSANVIPLRDNIADLTSLIDQYKGINKSNYETELPRLAEVEKELDLEYTLKETKELVDGIEEGARRTHTIVEGLTTFSRGDSVQKSKADINRGIKSTLSVLKSRLNEVNLTSDLQSDLPLVSCQVGKINQVVLNLMNNALDALEDKYGANSAKSELSIKTWHTDNHVRIQVQDNADGMDEETREKVLEPFYTTKPVGKGTGLGLSISYSIIEDHKGDIELISAVGEGTTFIISLPIEASAD